MPSNPEPNQPLTDDELARIDKICEGGWTPAGLDQGRLWVTLTRYREANQVLEQAAILAVKTKDEVVAEVDRLRTELHEAHRTAGAEHGRAAALEAAYRETCTARDARDTELARLRAENTAQANRVDAFLAPHVLVHRNIAWYGEGGVLHVTEHSVCDYCVPQHASFNRREDIPEGPCEVRRALGVGDSKEPTNV